MDLMALLARLKDMIHRDPHNPYEDGKDPGGLMGQIEGLFRGQHEEYRGRYAEQGYGRDVDGDGRPDRPGGFGNVLPASQDPLGDPADQEPSAYTQSGTSRNAAYGQPQPAAPDLSRFPGVRPASEDPLGDPADQERR